jgi:hypothetical protein
MSLSTPQQVMERLEAIENDLAMRQNLLEQAALKWFRAKWDREHQWNVAYARTEGPAHVRKAEAIAQTAGVGVVEEAEWESLRAVVRVLETRATIGMALLKAQGRA